LLRTKFTTDIALKLQIGTILALSGSGLQKNVMHHESGQKWPGIGCFPSRSCRRGLDPNEAATQAIQRVRQEMAGRLGIGDMCYSELKHILPSGNLLHSYGKSPFSSWVNPLFQWGMFNSYVTNYQRVNVMIGLMDVDGDQLRSDGPHPLGNDFGRGSESH